MNVLLGLLSKRAIDEEAHRAATSDFSLPRKPTERQQQAGNYRKGHIRVGGLDIAIENPAGTPRKAGWTSIKAHYGYIKSSLGADGDHVDVFVKPGTDSSWSGTVYVIDQYKPDGTYDEAKCMLGYHTQDEATRDYLGSYQAGWKLGPVTAMPLAEFKAWLKGDTTKPLAKFDPDQERDESGRWTAGGSAANDVKLTPQNIGDLRKMITEQITEWRKRALSADRLSTGYIKERDALGLLDQILSYDERDFIRGVDGAKAKVNVENGKVVSGIQYVEWPEHVEVEYLASLKTGEGARLLKEAEEFARSKGKDVRLDALMPAVPFYQQHGYTVYEPSYHKLQPMIKVLRKIDGASMDADDLGALACTRRKADKLLGKSDLGALLKFNPDQDRDWHGRWTSTGDANSYQDGSTKLQGTGPHGRVTVEDVAKFFDAKTPGQMDINDPETVEHCIKLGLKEFDYQTAQGHTGLHWYNDNVAEAFEVTSSVMPELKDPENRMLFSVVAGIQSVQTPVNKNWEQAAESFAFFLKNGTMPVVNPENGKQWGLPPKAAALSLLNGLLSEKGVSGTLEFLFSMHTVKDLNDTKKRFGAKSNTVSGTMSSMRLGIEMLGEKVGPFVKNLNNISDTTVDLWASRTFARYTGNLTGKTAGKPTEPERRVIKEAFGRIARERKTTPQQVQAALWIYEQSLYSKLGVPNDEAKTFADGAKAWVVKHARRS